MTTERSSFDDQGTAGAMGDDALGNVDALVGTREDTMTSSGLSDAPSTHRLREHRDLKSSRQPTDPSGDRLQDAASSVADRVADTAQQQVGTRVESQLGRGADVLGQVSQAIRQSGEQLRSDQPQIASFADTAAEQVDRASQYLRQTDFQGLVRGAEDFARRQPAVFLGGALRPRARGLPVPEGVARRRQPARLRARVRAGRLRSYGIRPLRPVRRLLVRGRELRQHAACMPAPGSERRRRSRHRRMATRRTPVPARRPPPTRERSMAEPRTERSLGELFGSLTSQLGQLVHKEIELARTEMTANVVRTGRNASLIGVGGAVAYGGFLVVLAAAVGVLMMLGLDLWLAALIVGLVVIGIGYALIQRGRSQLEAGSLAPTRTIETLKDDAEWAKDQTR